MDFNYIYTDRLKLRLLSPETRNLVFETLDDAAIKRFFGIVSDTELELERLKHQKGMTTYNRTYLLFQLLDKDSDVVMGGCGLHNWMPEHSRSEIGYALNDDQYKQKGFMTEAVRVVIDYGFQILNLNRLEALVGSNNTASLRLIQKMNFTKEGVLREHYCKNGILEDSVVFGLLKSEYHPA